jgi:hypothetical protein
MFVFMSRICIINNLHDLERSIVPFIIPETSLIDEIRKDIIIITHFFSFFFIKCSIISIVNITNMY